MAPANERISLLLFATSLAVAACGSRTPLDDERVRVAWGVGGVGPVGGSTSIVTAAQGGRASTANAQSSDMVVAGDHHSCALLSGAAYCWGLNRYGELGNGSMTQSLVASLVDLDKEVSSISSHGYHNCALKRGDVWCWGYNSNGQLGDGSLDNRSKPVRVSGMDSPALAIATGFFHTCAQTSTGVWCWGYNNCGQIGNGGNTDVLLPARVKGIGAGVTAIVAGYEHSCAVESGVLKCWGCFKGAELRDQAVADSLVPVVAFDPQGTSRALLTAAAGRRQTCVLLGSSVTCWGDGNAVGLGVVQGLDDQVTELTIGYYHGCALRAGVSWCWGDNWSGDLGNGSTVSSDVALRVQGLPSGVSSIAAGFQHSCATVENRVYCWGNNQDGQLGDGSRVDSLAPVEVRFAELR